MGECGPETPNASGVRGRRLRGATTNLWMGSLRRRPRRPIVYEGAVQTRTVRPVESAVAGVCRCSPVSHAEWRTVVAPLLRCVEGTRECEWMGPPRLEPAWPHWKGMRADTCVQVSTHPGRSSQVTGRSPPLHPSKHGERGGRSSGAMRSHAFTRSTPATRAPLLYRAQRSLRGASWLRRRQASRISYFDFELRASGLRRSVQSHCLLWGRLPP
jgi:hypothetical protein